MHAVASVVSDSTFAASLSQHHRTVEITAVMRMCGQTLIDHYNDSCVSLAIISVHVRERNRERKHTSRSHWTHQYPHVLGETLTWSSSSAGTTGGCGAAIAVAALPRKKGVRMQGLTPVRMLPPPAACCHLRRHHAPHVCMLYTRICAMRP